MNMTEPIDQPAAVLRGSLRLNEPMARHVTWRAGGAAARAYSPADTADLSAFLRTLPAAEPVQFVGLGSNLLVRDGGYRGTVVLLHDTRASVRVEGALLYADAGVAAPKVARFAGTHALEGAEFLAGIPGTVGGALAMNAGCYGCETWDIVAKARTISRGGELRERSRDEFDVGYRHVALPGARLGEDEWFVGGWFALRPGDGERSRARIKHLLGRRIATQPLGLPNAGSVFRNPPGDHAARLIEACGLKGYALGGARISEKHANFIVNPEGRARAADIEALIEHARSEVSKHCRVDLVPEVRIIGEPA
jgi:UDP-N-acetylmuramate dehydrogenase